MTDLDTEFSEGADAPVAESAQQREPTAPSRDESGRFAGRQEPQEPEAGANEQTPEGEGQAAERQQMVPHAALHAARQETNSFKEKFGTLEARFQDQSRQIEHLLTLMGGQNRQQPEKPAAPPPDWYQEPDAALNYGLQQHLTPVQKEFDTRFQNVNAGFVEQTRFLAGLKYGDEAVQTAEVALDAYVKTNPQAGKALYDRMFSPGRLPAVEMVKWHKEQSTLERFGQDPEAAINAEVERRLAAMGHTPQPQQAAPQQQPAAPGAMPSNFAGGRSAAPRGGAGNTSGPRPLSDIFGGR